jgi:hypothetical protein
MRVRHFGGLWDPVDMTNEPANDDAHPRRLAELQQRLRDSPGGQARARWDSLRRSAGVFERNAGELVQLLRVAETDEQLVIELFQNVRPTNVPEEYFGRLDQRLHNMLAAAVSLVDHTRRLTRSYEGTEFLDQLTRRNDEIRIAGESLFLRSLRNYLLHYGVLGFVHHVTFQSGDQPLVGEVRVNCSELLRWDGWTAGAKAYIESCGETVHLTKAVEAYVESMRKLYYWMFAQFEGLHSGDIDEANKIVQEYNLTLTGGVSDGRDHYERMARVVENLQSFEEGREQTSHAPPRE